MAINDKREKKNTKHFKRPDEKKEQTFVIKEKPEIKMISVKDNYLPSVLVKLKICENNAQARKMIRGQGIMLNDNLTKNTDATNNSEQFEIEIDKQKYQIFLVD